MNDSINAEIMVVNSNDDGPAVNPVLNALTAAGSITLRSAIQRSNQNGENSNSINFNIPDSGSMVISVGTGIGVTGQALPMVTNQLTINGYTQAGSSIATSTSAAIISIVLNGSAVTTGTFQDGLLLGLGSDNSVIKGLVIQSFPQNGITIQNGMGQFILGNYIGTNQAGTSGLPNLGNGIVISSNASAVSIGSFAHEGTIGNRNIISGQESTTGSSPVSGAGIFIEGKNNQIIGNYVGVSASGIDPLSNRTGIYILASGLSASSQNGIQNNIIAFNNGANINEGSGIIVDGADQNFILSNSIYDNMNDAISLINNGNDALVSPLLATATISGTTLQLGGTFSSSMNANSSFLIQFFTNPTENEITQGQSFIGQMTLETDATGNAAFNNVRLFSNVLANQFVSATITLLNLSGTPLTTSSYALNLIIAQGQVAGSIDTTVSFDAFPGIKAQSVVVDSVGRIIVGGLNGSIVRYDLAGVIDLTYAIFPGTMVKALLIDDTDAIIAVGSEGSVVKYNSAGAISSLFAAFPGVLANAVVFDSGGDVIVGGLQSTLVRYSNSGANLGTIVTTFDEFPGTAINGLALDSVGNILACGLQGEVVRYASTGIIDIAYAAFPGISGNAIAIDSSDRALVVGKTFFVTSSAVNAVGGNLSVGSSITSLNVVRYTTEGIIDLNFTTFPGINAQNVLLDKNANIVVCGLESTIVQYNSSTGTINFTFAPFPGVDATWMTLTSSNQIIVVGWHGSVTQYYN